MADMKVSAAAQVQAAPQAEAKPEQAEGVIGKHLTSLKNALFGDTGKAILAGAASGALIGGLPGALVGGAVGLGLAASVQAADQGKTGMSLLNAGLAGAVAAVAFPPVGALLVGATAFAFASGAAQKAASKIGEFLGLHGKDNQAPKAEPAPAQ